jgi:hypothetical protein
MSKHNKILDSWKTYDKNDIPTYHIIKSSKYGTFKSTVTPCEQDYANINDWDGYRFAERKCDIQIMHAKAKKMKERAQGILDAYKALHTKYKARREYLLTPALADLYYQYEIAQREYEKVYKQYVYMKDSFSEYTSRMIERREQLNKKLNEKRAAELRD